MMGSSNDGNNEESALCFVQKLIDLNSVEDQMNLGNSVDSDSTKLDLAKSNGQMSEQICKTEPTNSEEDFINTTSEGGHMDNNIKIESPDFVDMRSVNKTAHSHYNKPNKMKIFEESQRETNAANNIRLRPKQKSYRKKVETLWSHKNILKLIKAVEARRSLWDTSCAEYNKFQKDMVWQEVANFVRESVNNCRGKWANLRTTFGFNLKKYKREKIGRDVNEEPQISWRYFKPMMFLHNKRECQAMQSVSYLPSEPETRDDSLINNFSFNEDLTSVLHTTNGQHFSQKSSPTISPAPSNSVRNAHFNDMTAETFQYLRTSDSQLKETCTAFGDYIAAELASLPPEMSAIARAKMRRSFSDILDEVALMLPHYKKHQ